VVLKYILDYIIAFKEKISLRNMERNLGDYMTQFKGKYQELKEQGKNLYTVEVSSERFVIALLNQDRMVKINEPIKLTTGDVAYLIKLFPKIPIKDFYDMNIFQYEDPENSMIFKLSDLEEVLESGKSKVCELCASVPS